MVIELFGTPPEHESVPAFDTLSDIVKLSNPSLSTCAALAMQFQINRQQAKNLFMGLIFINQK